MRDHKSDPTSLLFEVRLENGRDTTLVDNTLYRQLVGSFLHLSHTRQDLSFVVGVVSRYMWESHELHLKAAKRRLWYVQGTINYGVLHASVPALDLMGFIDSDWAGENTDHKSTFEYTISLLAKKTNIAHSS
jgi:hypothetical protein